MSLLKEMLQVENEAVLVKLETIIKQSNSKRKKNKGSAHDFLGALTKKDALLMTKAIEEGCEQIHPDDWK